MSERYSVTPYFRRGLLGQISVSDHPVRLGDEHRTARSTQPQAGARERPITPGPTLEDLRRSVGDLLRSLDAPQSSQLHTTDGHPIHLDAAAHDSVHHAMSPTGHHEAGEILRQAAKLLFHLRDVKQQHGDGKGARLFEREARQALGRMQQHHDVAEHKQTMHAHAANAGAHAAEAKELAQQISGTDSIGLAEHEQAKTHPLYPRYAAARAGDQRASDGVRHAALAAMGRTRGSAHPVELNQFLAHHGHDAHGLAEDAQAGDAQLAHDPEKARLEKTLTGPDSVRPVRPTRMSEIAARGGRARNLAHAQDRGPAPRDPAQLSGQTVPRLSLAKSASAPADALRKSLVESHLSAAGDAADRGDEATSMRHALRAMELALAADGAAGGPTAQRDGDGDGRVDGPDDGDSDQDPTDPVRPVVKALERRPIRPDLSVLTHRPPVRAPDNRPGVGARVFRRYTDGTLDLEGARHAVLDVLWKLRDRTELTPIERAIAAVVLPEDDDAPPAVELTLGRLSDEERRRLTAAVAAHLLQIAHADAQRTLARSADAWSLPGVRKHLTALLLQDPFGVGTKDIIKAYAPVDPAGSAAPAGLRGGAGSRGGKVAYTTRSGRPVYASQARRMAPQMGAMMERWHHRATATGHPEDHAVAAKQALAAAFYHHHAGDALAAQQAMGYADHHAGKARVQGHQSRAMRWAEKHRPLTASLLAVGG